MNWLLRSVLLGALSLLLLPRAARAECDVRGARTARQADDVTGARALLDECDEDDAAADLELAELCRYGRDPIACLAERMDPRRAPNEQRAQRTLLLAEALLERSPNVREIARGRALLAESLCIGLPEARRLRRRGALDEALQRIARCDEHAPGVWLERAEIRFAQGQLEGALPDVGLRLMERSERRQRLELHARVLAARAMRANDEASFVAAYEALVRAHRAFPSRPLQRALIRLMESHDVTSGALLGRHRMDREAFERFEPALEANEGRRMGSFRVFDVADGTLIAHRAGGAWYGIGTQRFDGCRLVSRRGSGAALVEDWSCVERAYFAQGRFTAVYFVDGEQPWRLTVRTRAAAGSLADAAFFLDYYGCALGDEDGLEYEASRRPMVCNDWLTPQPDFRIRVRAGRIVGLGGRRPSLLRRPIRLAALVARLPEADPGEVEVDGLDSDEAPARLSFESLAERGLRWNGAARADYARAVVVGRSALARGEAAYARFAFGGAVEVVKAANEEAASGPDWMFWEPLAPSASALLANLMVQHGGDPAWAAPWFPFEVPEALLPRVIHALCDLAKEQLVEDDVLGAVRLRRFCAGERVFARRLARRACAAVGTAIAERPSEVRELALVCENPEVLVQLAAAGLGEELEHHSSSVFRPLLRQTRGERHRRLRTQYAHAVSSYEFCGRMEVRRAARAENEGVAPAWRHLEYGDNVRIACFEPGACFSVDDAHEDDLALVEDEVNVRGSTMRMRDGRRLCWREGEGAWCASVDGRFQVHSRDRISLAAGPPFLQRPTPVVEIPHALARCTAEWSALREGR